MRLVLGLGLVDGDHRSKGIHLPSRASYTRSIGICRMARSFVNFTYP